MAEHETLTLPYAGGCQTQDCDGDAIAVALAVTPFGPAHKLTGILACSEHEEDTIARWIFAATAVVRVEPPSVDEAERIVREHAIDKAYEAVGGRP